MEPERDDLVSLRVAELRAEMESLNGLADAFGRKLVTALAGAVIQGRSLSDVFRGLALSTANQALGQALRPLGTLAGDALTAGIVPQAVAARSTHITFNVSTPDAASFKQSQGQIAAQLARAVARGERNA